MKRIFCEAFGNQEETQSNKRQKLNDGTIRIIKYNHNQIQQLISNQQKIIEEFSKTINELKNELRNNNNKIRQLEEKVEKQQLTLRQFIPPTQFSSSPPSYIN